MTRASPSLIIGSICIWLFLPANDAWGQDASWVGQLKPQLNPELAQLPSNTWKLLQPKGDVFNHPKTEVGLVYDEGLGGVIYFGGCSQGYCNTVWLYHVG